MKNGISSRFLWVEALLIRGLVVTCVAISVVHLTQALVS
jgi:hypothetical protein